MKQLQSILNDTNAHVEAALADSRVTVVTQDCDLTYLAVINPIAGYGPEIIGKKPADVYPPDVASRIIHERQEVVKTRVPSHHRLKLELNGRLHHFDNSVYPTLDAHGQCVGITIISVDLTDLIDAQRALSNANDKLMKLLEKALDNG